MICFRAELYDEWNVMQHAPPASLPASTMRLSLATTLQSHAALHDLFASPEQLTFDRLTAYLDLLAHLERIDAKLTRTARQLLDKGGGTEEQEKVCRTYARDAEGRRKRRNGYIGWSLMLRRWVSP